LCLLFFYLVVSLILTRLREFKAEIDCVLMKSLLDKKGIMYKLCGMYYIFIINLLGALSEQYGNVTTTAQNTLIRISVSTYFTNFIQMNILRS
jgi:hypothetical protein